MTATTDITATSSSDSSVIVTIFSALFFIDNIIIYCLIFIIYFLEINCEKRYNETMNYFINTYGCQMNVHESEKIAGILENMGYSAAAEEKSADIVVFNTCCIRETAEQKIYGNLGIVKRYKKLNPNLIVVTCGCMVQQDSVKENIKTCYPFVDIILGTTNLHLLPDAIAEVVNKRRKTSDTTIYNPADNELTCSRTSFPNAWVNIIYGCNNFCTYCIVPYVRGRERSRPMSEIVIEITKLLAEGYKEITLLGQNVNSYGNDLSDGTDFAALLEELGKIDTKFRLRFMTSHPKDLTDSVIDAIAKYPNICNYIHLPVQSGSNKVLSDMNRRYTREHYLDLIAKIKNRIPGVGITTDIMVGFPTETEEDFADTLSLVEAVGYSSAFCFIYSPRTGTPAAEMPQLPYAVKQQRIAQLLKLQNAITKKQSASMHGKIYEVLVEDVNNKYDNTYCGRTESGRLVNFKSEKDIIGQFVSVRIAASKSATLFGDIVTE
jgi:tRNA-2-methylthio-N6-dimethylallyladenosine synthase